MKAQSPVRVSVPGPGEDRPSWIKVGVIAAIGFVAGVAWPRLAGVRLGPHAPDAHAAAAPPAASQAPGGGSAPVASVPPTGGAPGAPAVASAEPAPVPGASTLTVLKQAMLSCRTDDGEVLKGTAACGAVPAFDAIALPKLRQLARCPTADGALGKLTVHFTLDFNANKITSSVARGSTVENHDTFLMCVQSMFQHVSLSGLEHAHPRYIAAYTLGFAASKGGGAREVAAHGAKGAAATPAAAIAAKETPEPAGNSEGPTSQVVWEVSIVRDAPRTGQVVARLQRGTQVHVGRGQEGWFRVRFGPGFATEGWVYRGSIGR